jgi:hypothetical protein
MVMAAVFEVIVVVLVVVPGNCGASAVMFTTPLLVLGVAAGAVYTPTCTDRVDETMVPTWEFPPATPFTYQVTAVFVVDVLVVFARFTVALNCSCVFSATVAVVGVISIDVTLICPLPPPHDISAPNPSTASGAHNIPSQPDLRIRLFIRPLRSIASNWHRAEGEPLKSRSPRAEMLAAAHTFGFLSRSQARPLWLYS